jgi:cytochrome c-type biogenesis protein CcmH/NrfG
MNLINDIQAKQIFSQLERSLSSVPAEEAIERIGLFLADYPDYAQAHNDLGVLRYQQGDKLQALGRYERAVRLAPDNRTFRLNLASFYFVELGWADDAIFMYTELLKGNPNDTEVLGALALISKHTGQPEQARIFLQKILTLEPWNQEARTALADLSSNTAPLQTGNVFTSAPVSNPPQSDVDDLLAELKKSIAGLAPAAAQQPAPSTGDPRIAPLESQLREQPTNARLHNDLGVVLSENGELERALSHHELAHRYAPDNLIFLKNYAGICACHPGRIDKAIELLTGALKKYPRDVEILAGLVQLCLQVGQADEAMIFLRRILDFEPWNQDARSLVTKLQDPATRDFFLSR